MSFHFVVILLTGFPPHPPQGWISLWFSYFGSGYSSNFKPPTWTWSPISWNSLFPDVWNTFLADWRMSCFQEEEWERILQDLASDLAVIFEKSSPQAFSNQVNDWFLPLWLLKRLFQLLVRTTDQSALLTLVSPAFAMNSPQQIKSSFIWNYLTTNSRLTTQGLQA